jgi:probable HAF family extracellular repeat protein
VVGSANTEYIDSHFHAYLYSDDMMQDIDMKDPYDEKSEAWAINNSGMVVGSERDGGVFLYSDGLMTRLNIFGNAYDINERNEFVGWGSWGPDLEGAFLYKEGEITALGNLSNSGRTFPHAINESGLIVGYSSIGYVERPWGYSHMSHAFLYDNGMMTDLNTLIPENSSWELMYATDINDRGQIVGYGVRNGEFQEKCYKNDKYIYCHNFPVYSAFLLSPILEITINIKPRKDFNSVNPKMSGIIPIAILSTRDFNAPNQINRKSLTFGSTGNEESLAFCSRLPKDVDGDGLKDVVCYFYSRLTGFQCGDTEGILRGNAIDGTPIEGVDLIEILQCR